MSTPKDRLGRVEFTRSYKAENASEIHLVGASRWIKDIELLLEEKWPNLKCYPESKDAAAAISELLPTLVLVEPNAYQDPTARWIETCVQFKAKALLIGPDSISQFEWAMASKKAAAHNFGSVLFSSDSSAAAGEISDFLETSNALNSSRWLEDVRVIQSAQLGYEVSISSPVRLEKEVFALISDEFVIPSEDLAKSLTLVNSVSLWKRPKDAESDLNAAYRRVERELADTEAYKLIQISLSLVKAFKNGELTEANGEEILKASSLGLLARRRLKSKLNEVSILLNSASGHSILKIA